MMQRTNTFSATVKIKTINVLDDKLETPYPTLFVEDRNNEDRTTRTETTRTETTRTEGPTIYQNALFTNLKRIGSIENPLFLSKKHYPKIKK
jgi:hypothetical protein